MNDLRMPTEDATAKSWSFVERAALVFAGGLAKGMGNHLEVLALTKADGDGARRLSPTEGASSEIDQRLDDRRPVITLRPVGEQNPAEL